MSVEGSNVDTLQFLPTSFCRNLFRGQPGPGTQSAIEGTGWVLVRYESNTSARSKVGETFYDFSPKNPQWKNQVSCLYVLFFYSVNYCIEDQTKADIDTPTSQIYSALSSICQLVNKVDV